MYTKEELTLADEARDRIYEMVDNGSDPEYAINFVIQDMKLPATVANIILCYGFSF